MKVWYAHARREYGTARAARGRLAVRAIFPEAEIVDPECVRWGPEAVDLLEGCDAVAWLRSDPVGLGVLRELEVARLRQLPVVEVTPLVGMPQQIVGRVAVAKVAYGERLIHPMHQREYGYTFGVWREEVTYPPPGGRIARLLFHPVGDGATFTARGYLVAGGVEVWSHTEHVPWLHAVTWASAIPAGSYYTLNVQFDTPGRGGNIEQGAIGDVPVVHLWWPGA